MHMVIVVVRPRGSSDGLGVPDTTMRRRMRGRHISVANFMSISSMAAIGIAAMPPSAMISTRPGPSVALETVKAREHSPQKVRLVGRRAPARNRLQAAWERSLRLLKLKPSPAHDAVKPVRLRPGNRRSIAGREAPVFLRHGLWRERLPLQGISRQALGWKPWFSLT